MWTMQQASNLLPARTKVNILQKKKSESSTSTMYDPQHLPYNKKLLQGKKQKNVIHGEGKSQQKEIHKWTAYWISRYEL